MVVVAMNGNVVALKQDTKFEEWWDLCPKKLGKAMAKVKWDAITGPTGLRTRTKDRDAECFVHLTLSATPEELITGMKRYRETQIDKQTYKIKDEGRFTCHPATWLNQGRWLD